MEIPILSSYLFRTACSTFGVCRLEVNPLHPTSSIFHINWLTFAVILLFVFVIGWRWRAKRITHIASSGRNEEVVDNKCLYSTTCKRTWYAGLQIYGTALLVLFFVVYIMYKGAVGDYAYYSYPISMIVSFLFLSFIVKKLPYHYICISLSLMIIFLCMQIPENLNAIGRRIELEYFQDKTVTLEKFERIDMAIREIRLNGNKNVFDSINNQEEIDYEGGYQYGSRYFPVAGIVRVLIWPAKIDGSRTKYLIP